MPTITFTVDDGTSIPSGTTRSILRFTAVGPRDDDGTIIVPTRRRTIHARVARRPAST